MDPNSKLTVVVNAISSSVRSLLFSCGLLKRNRRRDAPIDRLPNELMQMIVAKLELDGDLTNLIRLGSVSTRWRAMIEDFCPRKKSLIVVMQERWMDKRSNIYVSFMLRFFGFENMKHFLCIFLLNSQMPSQYLQSVLNLFANIEHLSIRCDFARLVLTPTLLRDLCKLTHLLEIDLFFIEMYFSELEQTANQHQLTSLVSVLTCKITFTLRSDLPVSAHQFARVMSIILPNLVNLDLTCYGKSSVDSQFQNEIEQHLKQFPNLCKHKIKVHV